MDSLTRSFLALDVWLDSTFSVKDWDLRVVAATSAVFFLSIRFTAGRTYKIDWDAFVHALLTSILSTICVWIDISAVEIRGLREPLGSVLCHGALTNFHRLTPALTQGYAICDFINGFTLGKDAIAHGVATFAVMTYFNEMGASHIITPMLFMEISTTVLATIKASFFTPGMTIAAQGLFALSFLFCRICVTPYIMYTAIRDMYIHGTEDCFGT
eukprot:CAMPEP_0195523482 /NCGR_PEP_ID=MMETSP0794_2-20130614/22705_1 /TAXON_ID=515487 /ORGANISM="Stephanopyxis turris, Strain CCMP 815" /LENGTH=213 /DNA_ID=CAMNT_0040653493 /DNA_START=176 /DNA_END=814 /DNA_ORIENTATION=+